MKKAKVYIDGSNVFYTQKKLGWSLDWARVKKFLERDREILEYRYYQGVKDGDDKMLSFLRYLNKIGLTAITKPLKKIKVSNFGLYPQAKPTGYIYKSNFDVEITADMLLDKSRHEEVILFSGDSDFEYLIKLLTNLGKEILIVSSHKTLSWELKLAASRIMYLETIKSQIMREIKPAGVLNASGSVKL